MAQYTGQVLWFDNVKGFGFLRRDGGRNVFCHFSAVALNGEKSLTEGEAVTFDTIQGAKGEQAHHVRRAVTPQPQAVPVAVAPAEVTPLAAAPQDAPHPGPGLEFLNAPGRKHHEAFDDYLSA